KSVKSDVMKKIIQSLFLFLIGGISYHFIEILWRGYSHFSMFVLGGICFVTIGLMREYFVENNIGILTQLIVACITITALELIFVLILNIVFKLDIWDYSDLRFNFLGQISLLYSVFWIFLSLPIIIIDGFLKYWFFGKEKPDYKIIDNYK